MSTPAGMLSADQFTALLAKIAPPAKHGPKVPCPQFKGNGTEDPSPHIKSASDWMELNNVEEADKPAQFRFTLVDKAREWYGTLTDDEIDEGWDAIKSKFEEHFSPYGRSESHWYERWRQLKFDPDQDSIDDYIHDVETIARYLKQPESAQVTVLKNTMPQELRAVLYKERDLQTLIRMLKDIYAKKPQRNSTTPHALSILKDNSAQRVRFSPDESLKRNEELEERLAEITETLSQMAKPLERQQPYKPSVWKNVRGNFRGRGRGNFRSDRSPNFRSQSGDRQRYRSFSRDRQHTPFDRRDFRSRSGDRRPPSGRGRGRGGRPVNRDNRRCYNCQNFGHFAKECRFSQENTSQYNRQQPRQFERQNSSQFNQTRQSRPQFRRNQSRDQDRSQSLPPSQSSLTPQEIRTLRENMSVLTLQDESTDQMQGLSEN